MVELGRETFIIAIITVVIIIVGLIVHHDYEYYCDFIMITTIIITTIIRAEVSMIPSTEALLRASEVETAEPHFSAPGP